LYRSFEGQHGASFRTARFLASLDISHWGRFDPKIVPDQEVPFFNELCSLARFGEDIAAGRITRRL
jgi:hypothetical protein